MYPTIKTPTCQTLSQNLHTPISHPTQRRCPSHHLHHRKLNLSPSHPAQRRWLPQETQPFLPAIQRSDDGSSLTFRPQETQPFLPAIQRSADGSSNSRESTQSFSPHQSPLPPVAPTPPPLPSARNRTAGETGAGLLRLCRRGADSWLAEICVVFKKSAV